MVPRLVNWGDLYWMHAGRGVNIKDEHADMYHRTKRLSSAPTSGSSLLRRSPTIERRGGMVENKGARVTDTDNWYRSQSGCTYNPPPADAERGSDPFYFISRGNHQERTRVMCSKRGECRNEVIKRRGRIESRKKNLEEEPMDVRYSCTYRGGFSSFPSWKKPGVGAGVVCLVPRRRKKNLSKSHSTI